MEYGEEQGKNILPFQNEHTKIQKYLSSDWYLMLRREQSPTLHQLIFELKEVNRQLWKLEDRIREFMQQTNGGDPSLVPAAAIADVLYIAFEIPKCNDVRATLVRKINALWGIDAKEKLYQG